ncbi:hypothetical protein [Prochlorococcus sp. MIT 1341]|uniref:hypothetical protein n=1 Tax=Prochlorococcus sp. MIT 1341 TaxID=3096221 RepID=UPI002A757FCA|nr:hypothetical protein [Prochlorococcus sp. MIT 1341]
MKKTTENEILASSSGWVAFFLNILPGLGAGYMYQRRWKAYWITIALTILWLFLSFLIQLGNDPSDPLPGRFENLGFYGLLIIAITTASEAGLKTKKIRELLEQESLF